LFNEKIKAKFIEIDSQVNPDMKIWTDKNVLSFVIRNLFANAIKFTPEKGKISIGVTAEGDTMKIKITDTGVGMSEETLSHLFKDRIMTTQVGTSGEQGTGLGLLLCNDMIKKVDGFIKAESELGMGSTFSITLPNK